MISKSKIYETSFDVTEFIAVTAYQNEEVGSFYSENVVINLSVRLNHSKSDTIHLQKHSWKQQMSNGKHRMRSKCREQDFIVFRIFSETIEEQTNNAVTFHSQASSSSGGPERLKIESYRASPYSYSQSHRKSSSNNSKVNILV